MKQAWLWWSSGKDSAWALHVMRRLGVEITSLVTTVNEEFDRVAMHAVRTELLRRQAQAVGAPLRIVRLPHPCSNAQYEAAVRELLREATRAGVRNMAFGDLFLEDVRAYREALLAGTRISPMFPLWGRDTSQLARAMIRSGLRAVLTCVDPGALAPDFAGREFDDSLLSDFPESVDPCGERGEFHTFAYAGPMFSSSVAVELGERRERDGFVFADLVPRVG